MPTIVTRSHFTKNNGLYISLAVPTAVATTSTAGPTNIGTLDNLIELIEKSLLVNALQSSLYNELQAALADIDNAANAKWKKMVQGDSYDGKMWLGLNHDYVFIAQKIFETYVTQNEDFLTTTGNRALKSEKTKPRTPVYKIAAASQAFFKNYQGGYLYEPEVTEVHGVEFTDFVGQGYESTISFYQYLLDKKADFPTWDPNKFRTYSELDEIKNSFGL